MTAYVVRAKRWQHGWELHIDGVGVTQSSSLRDAEIMARDYIALDLDVSPDSFDLTIVPHLGEGLDEETQEARRAVVEADRAQRQAAARSRDVARRMKRRGLTGRDIAAVLGLSPQRVSQLLKG